MKKKKKIFEFRHPLFWLVFIFFALGLKYSSVFFLGVCFLLNTHTHYSNNKRRRNDDDE